MNTLEKKRLRWRCRRGMLELDQLLQHFFDQRFEHLSYDKQKLFAQLIQVEDQQLYDWFMGNQVPPENFKDLLDEIKTVAQTKR